MTGRNVIAVILIVIAVLAIAAGVVYLIEPIHSLPSFFPGHTKGTGGHLDEKHTKRGLAALAFGVVCLVVGIVLTLSGRRERAASYRY